MTSSFLHMRFPHKIGKLPPFGNHLPPIIFPLKRENFIEFSNENALLSQHKFYCIFELHFRMKMPYLVHKVSTKYNDEMYLHHVSYKRIKGGNMSPCSKIQLEVEGIVTE